MISIQYLVDEAKCYSVIRELRWPDDSTACTRCGSVHVKKDGHGRSKGPCQHYLCLDCGSRFHDLTDTVLSGHHKPLKTWVSCIYLMGLNLSNRQISQELELSESDAQYMTDTLRQGIVDRKPDPELSGTVECDELYQVAGHKGHPEAVKKSGS